MTGFFIGEMCLKIISLGFCFAPKVKPFQHACSLYLTQLSPTYPTLSLRRPPTPHPPHPLHPPHPQAYLKDPWNILDFTIVIISILGLLASIVPVFGQLKSLRILRVLRPLRLLQRNPGMKIIITSLIRTMPAVVDVCAVVMVFHIVFSIMGMMIFSGQFGSCTNEEITVRAQCFPTPEEIQRFPHLYPALYAAAQRGEPHPLDASTEGEAPAERRRALLKGSEGSASSSHALLDGAVWSAFETPMDEAPPTSSFAVKPSAAKLPPSPLKLPPSPLPLAELPAEATDAEVAGVGAASTTSAVATSIAAASAVATVEGSEGDSEATRRREQIATRRRLNARRKTHGRALKGGGGGEDSGAELPTEWLNPPFGSFDDFGSAMLILYAAQL